MFINIEEIVYRKNVDYRNIVEIRNTIDQRHKFAGQSSPKLN